MKNRPGIAKLQSLTLADVAATPGPAARCQRVLTHHLGLRPLRNSRPVKTLTIGSPRVNPPIGGGAVPRSRAARLMPAHGQLFVDRVDVAGKDSADTVQLGQGSR